MRARLVVPVVVALLSGCGSAATEGSEDGAAEPAGERTATGASDATCVPVLDEDVPTTRIGRTDLDGDGAREEVRTVDAGRCAGTIYVKGGWGHVETTAVDGPAPTTAYDVRLQDGTWLLVTRAEHPRGGFQVRAYDLVDRRLVELVDDAGTPLVPFVATDTSPGTPLSVTCTDDGLRVTEAVRVGPALEEASDLVAPQEEGWQLVETTYAVDDGRVEETGNDGVPGIVPHGELAAERPDLVGHAVLEDCRA